MASMVTNVGAAGLTSGGSIDWGTGSGGDTIKARVCKAGTLDQDDTVMTGKTAVAGTTDITLTGKSKTTDNTNNRIIFSATSPLSWTGVSDGAASALFIAIYKFVTNDADSIPISYIDVTDLSLASVSQLNYTIPADGLAYSQQ